MRAAVTAKPFRERRGDWAFVAVFAFFTWSSFFADTVNALDVRIAADSPNPLARAAWWYASDTDPLLIENPLSLRIQTAISAFVFGPFYVVLIYAFVRGRDWIRLPALLYVSAMTYGMVVFLSTEYFSATPPTNQPKFLAFNVPYLVVPLLLGWRMRRECPFAT
jgi:hypothetical protein